MIVKLIAKIYSLFEIKKDLIIKRKLDYYYDYNITNLEFIYFISVFLIIIIENFKRNWIQLSFQECQTPFKDFKTKNALR